MGFDLVKKAMQDGSAELVIMSRDLSEKTKKEVLYLTEQLETEHVDIPETLDELWYIIGKRAGVMAITDYALAKKIIDLDNTRGNVNDTKEM